MQKFYLQILTCPHDKLCQYSMVLANHKKYSNILIIQITFFKLKYISYMPMNKQYLYSMYTSTKDFDCAKVYFLQWNFSVL